VTDDWISDETERKEADFRGLLRMHINICKGIMSAGWAAPYLYVDLHAGPGLLEHKGRRFDGSPMIAKDLLTRAGIPTETVHFEQDPDVAARLRDAMSNPCALFDPGLLTTQIRDQPFQSGFPEWLSESGHQANRYGLVYSDPIRDEIPYATLNQAAEMLPRVDLLAYVSATQYKRRRGQDLQRNGSSERPLLGDHIRAVNKRIALIREPLGAWQWTFVLWTNWTQMPEWERRGFWRLNSDKGRHVLDRLNLTDAQHREKANTPLPIPDDDPPYRSYREYLRHPRFLAVRARAFTRSGGSCEQCRTRPPTEPHHLRYPPWGTFDVVENLIAVCHPCHCQIHGKAS
jgi:hypothetical protein